MGKTDETGGAAADDGGAGTYSADSAKKLTRKEKNRQSALRSRLNKQKLVGGLVSPFPPPLSPPRPPAPAVSPR